VDNLALRLRRGEVIYRADAAFYGVAKSGYIPRVPRSLRQRSLGHLPLSNTHREVHLFRFQVALGALKMAWRSLEVPRVGELMISGSDLPV
jgi:hypothetical protein